MLWSNDHQIRQRKCLESDDGQCQGLSVAGMAIGLTDDELVYPQLAHGVRGCRLLFGLRGVTLVYG